MAKQVYDIVVIGSGPGGYVAAIRAAQLGFKTACIEKEKTLGGTCLNVGCIPSKALLQSSEYYALMQHEAQEHGLSVNGLSYDFNKMQDRKGKIVEGLVNSVASQFKRNSVTWVPGTAKFIDPHTVRVANGKENQDLEAKWFILATGSEPIPLPFLPFDEKAVVSSTGALALPKPPKKLLVIGAGVIGVELASVYNRLGSEVTVIEMLDHICPAMDKAVGRMLLQVLKKQGLVFHLGAKVTQAQKKNEGVTLTVELEGKPQQFAGDAVLVAVGRRPYTNGLGLAEAGVKVGPKGFVEVDKNLRTSQGHIYAIGDLVEGPMLAHKASEEGVVAVEIIAGLHPHINYMAIPNVIYTHPEVAAIGLTEQEALAKGLKLKIGQCLFKGNPRARCMGYMEGMVKVIGEEKTGALIGMHIIGPHASEMIGEGVIAMDKHSTLEDLARASHAHPTLCEAIHEASLLALGRAIHM